MESFYRELHKVAMPAPEKIKRLVEVFERNLPAYKRMG
jgi:hypothetical protein